MLEFDWNFNYYTIGCICVICIINILVRSWYLICGSKICGLAYGIVNCKQTKQKLINSYANYKTYPWNEDDYKYNKTKPMRAYVKTFYYVDVVLCNIEGEIKHIGICENDFKSIEEGDKVIVIRFKNNEIIAIPASDK